MRSLRKVLAAVALSLVTVTGVPAVSHAESWGGDFELPQRWNEDFKPGTRCTPPGSRATYVTATRRWFDQTDSASVANFNDEPVPVTHTVTEKRTRDIEISATITPKYENKLLEHVSRAYGFNYSYSEYWKLNQKVGPYMVAPRSQGELVWGFIVLDTENQDVVCGDDLVWRPVGRSYGASVPEAKYSELRIDEAEIF